MIIRPFYLNELISYIDKPFIKVIAGIRRAGKSSLLEQLKGAMVARGVPEGQIALINFDSIDYTFIREKSELVQLEKELLSKGVRYFLFDEIQNIDHWDEAVSALYAEKNTDIFITGSNSKLLSTELSTFFTVRYVDFKVFTLNFKETLEFKRALGNEIQDIGLVFEEYLARGGFPSLYVARQSERQDDAEVTDIYNSILFHDLVERKGLRNTELLARVTRFVLDNIGSPVSAKSISDYLKNEKLSLSQETVYKYLNWLEEALIISRVQRYDVRGKEILKSLEKFYLADVGLLYAINGRSSTYLSGVLENVVYHELASHGYEVYVGNNAGKEVDFVARKGDKKMYIQVAAHIDSPKTWAREYGAYEGISDNYPKYVLSLDRHEHAENGILGKYLPEFVLGL
ncbi:ATP-binding protein [Candidatus Saccharibacteria bacterium]|nr:ATP-binding protein [Candidatus Saccharibacteria bacterium]